MGLGRLLGGDSSRSKFAWCGSAGHQTLPIVGVQVSNPAAAGGTLRLEPGAFGIYQKRDSLHTFSLHFYSLLSSKAYPAGAGQALPFQLPHLPWAHVGFP